MHTQQLINEFCKKRKDEVSLISSPVRKVGTRWTIYGRNSPFRLVIVETERGVFLGEDRENRIRKPLTMAWLTALCKLTGVLE